MSRNRYAIFHSRSRSLILERAVERVGECKTDTTQSLFVVVDWQ